MCGGPKWKREEVQDHKFDFVDTRDYLDNGIVMRLKYLWLYIIMLKSFLVYILDIFSATTMLTTTSWSNEIFNECFRIEDCIFIPFDVGKWLFVGCIAFGFLLLAYESRKTKRIIASRDISYAFTNVMANNYYSLRSYAHFCFFDHISNSTKLSDDFAFFVFFVFKSWKRLLLSDGPRQAINALTLYAIYLVKKETKPGDWYDAQRYFDGNSLSTSALTVSTFFTVAVFAGSLLLLIVAGLCYIPLLCHIRGNLKEYCCHKVDKRIEEVMKRQRDKRVQENLKLERKEARGDFSHLKNKKGGKPLPQPTLPTVSMDEFEDDASMRTRGPAPSTYTQDYYYYDKGDYPPPMPAYSPFTQHQHTGSAAHFDASQASLGYDNGTFPQRQQTHDEDDESVAHLTTTAAPFAQQAPFDRPESARPYIQSATPAPAGDGYDSYGYQHQDIYHPQHQDMYYPQHQDTYHPQHQSTQSSQLYTPTGMPYDSPVAPQQNPYGGYTSYNSTPQMQHQMRRAYDEENQAAPPNGGGGYAM